MKIEQPSRRFLTADLLAGFTFAVANIPTAMAHALMATVNPVLGIYTLMFAVPVGAIFTSSVFMNISTSSALSMATGSSLQAYSGDAKVQALATLVLLVGLIQLTAGLLKAGSLLRFVPHSVMVGFMNGVAVLIILGQMSDLTGYESEYSNRVFQTLDMLLNRELIYLPSLGIGLLTMAIIVGLNQTRLRKVSAIMGLGIATALVAVMGLFGVELISDIATVPSALPRPAVPDLSLIFRLLLPAFSVAVIGLVQGAVISQNYPNPDGKFPDASRDFLGQGAANAITSVFGGIPAGGSSSGTALNMSSGAKSRWTNIFAGLFVIIIILLFSPVIGFIPMPALAGLVILAGFQSLQIPQAVSVWQTGRVSGVAMLLTFTLTLFIPLQFAVVVGVAFSIMLYVIQASNRVQLVQVVPQEGGFPLEAKPPKKLPENEVTMLMIYGSVFFAASQAMESVLPSPDKTKNAVVILGLRGQLDVGSTFIAVLGRYLDSLRAHGSKLMLVGVDKATRETLVSSGFLKEIGKENVFMATPQFGEPMNKALSAAREWIASNLEKTSPESTS
jgi:SulP family sulfate permease